ncbi:MAG: hypothetical protein OHK0021_22740 [Bryobacter sp.]
MRRLLLVIGCLGLAALAAEGQIRGNYKGRLAGPEPGTQVDRAPRERAPRGRAFPRGRAVLPWWAGGWGGGQERAPERRERVEAKEPAKEDKLKELVVSPVYEKPKVNPKLIEIP